jgi:hypothetical protein
VNLHGLMSSLLQDRSPFMSAGFSTADSGFNQRERGGAGEVAGAFAGCEKNQRVADLLS